MKKKKAVLIFLIAIIIISVSAGIYFFRWMIQKIEAGTEFLNQMVLEDIDLSKIPDGEFEGSYESFPVLVKVSVSVSNHVITDIELLKHRNGQGKDAEAIVNSIVDAQSVKVDTISGATYSSKVIQKAVETALLSSIEVENLGFAESKVQFTEYVSNDYNFKLMIPTRMSQSKYFEVVINEEKYEKSLSLEFIDGNSLEGVYVGGVIFEIIISPVEVEGLPGELLKNAGKNNYIFYPIEGPIEHTGFSKIVEDYSSYISTIKESFKLTY